MVHPAGATPKTPKSISPMKIGTIQIKCRYSELVDISKIKPHPDNPNHHPPEQLAVLEKLIRAQGIRRPLVISHRSGLLIKGHGLLETCRKRLKLKQVPVEYQDYTSAAEEAADMVADNAVAQMADMPDAELLEIMRDVKKTEPSFDLTLFALPDGIMDALKDTAFLNAVPKLKAEKKGAAAETEEDTAEDAEHITFKTTFAAKDHAAFLGVINKRRKQFHLKTQADTLLHLAGLRKGGRK